MDQAAPNTLTVVGTGAASVRSDRGTLAVALEATKATPGEALSTLSELSHSVIAAARDHGVGEGNLRTQAMAVRPDIDPRSRRIMGYIAAHSLQLRLDVLDHAPQVLDAISQAAGEALRIGDFQLRSGDIAEARVTAATTAITEARTRAEHLAEAAGVRLGVVLSVVESQPPGPQPVPLHRAPPIPLIGIPVQGGTDEVTAEVTVTFQLMG